MATFYELHPDNPQTRTVEQIARELRAGAIMLYPTDTVYAIGCDLQAKSAVQRVRQLKQLANDKPLTFLCSSLSNIAEYAWVTDEAYRLMRRLIPGPYTFLLPATKLVPRLVMNPKRKTTGIRVPDNAVCQALLTALGNPIVSTSAYLPPTVGEFPQLGVERHALFDALDSLVDLIIDSDREPGAEVSTILDLSSAQPAVVRQGLGWSEIAHWVEVI
ncbi:MAG: threonylcarbamoyl-AMP synthase [Spirulinaceae cyanobacterium RM2_2_10]|nr:threonylcarbamoyl-AMP synthase [Spirulinaceae cyanobacterium SM2_1_0]NJO20953.1 threonylcarbamoyl-AMP synthase [Spirulinaceae cyanobacterium RM2_2_10]